MIHVCVKRWGLGAAAQVVPVAVLALALAAPAQAGGRNSTAETMKDRPASGPRAVLAAFQAPALTNTTPPPPTAAGIMQEIDKHAAELKDFVDRGVFNQVWVPALASKDVAVYLDDHLDDLDAAKREPAQAAVARLVRASWLLDAVGDLGNRPQVVAAFSEYSKALTDVHTFFPGSKP